MPYVNTKKQKDTHPYGGILNMVQCGANRRPRREGSMREYSIETIDYRIDIALSLIHI